MYLMVPKPLDSFNQLRVKGKGLKQKVLHASCEWYALEMVNKLWTLNCTLKYFKLQDSLCSEVPEVSLQFETFIFCSFSPDVVLLEHFFIM